DAAEWRRDDPGEPALDTGKRAFGHTACSCRYFEAPREGRFPARLAWCQGSRRDPLIFWPLSTGAQLVCSSLLAVTFRLLWGPAELTEAVLGRRFPRL